MDKQKLKEELAEVSSLIEEESKADTWDCMRLKKLVQKKERIILQLYTE